MRRIHPRNHLLGSLALTLLVGLSTVANAQDKYRDDNSQGQQQAAPSEAPADARGLQVRPVPVQPPVIVPAPVPVPPPARLHPEIWTDRGNYYLGDSLRAYFRVDADAYVYVFNTDAAGRQTQIFPNYYDGLNRVRAGQTYSLPNGRYDLAIEPPAGVETLTILAVAEDYPDIRAQYHGYSNVAPFAQGFTPPEALVRNFDAQAQVGYADAPADDYNAVKPGAGNDQRSVVVRPRPEPPRPAPRPAYVYGMQTIRFQTQNPFPPQRPPVPIPEPLDYGWLNISSTPSNAYLYIDGAYQGRTAQRFKIAAGQHTIELRKSGYASVTQTIFIEPGRTNHINIGLHPRNRYDYDIRFGYHGDDWDIEYGHRR